MVYQKIATTVAIVALTSGVNAQASGPSSEGGLVGSTPVGKGWTWINAPVVASATFPNSQADHWNTCNNFCKPQVDQYHLLGNVFTPAGSPTWTCECLTTQGAPGYGLESADPAVAYAFKGSHVEQASASTGGRKMLQDTPVIADDQQTPVDTTSSDTTSSDTTTEVGSTPQGPGYRWTGNVKYTQKFPTSGGAWAQCNPFCSNQKGLNQDNMLGNAITLGDKIQCSCIKWDGTNKIESAPANYYAFSGTCPAMS